MDESSNMGRMDLAMPWCVLAHPEYEKGDLDIRDRGFYFFLDFRNMDDAHRGSLCARSDCFCILNHCANNQDWNDFTIVE